MNWGVIRMDVKLSVDAEKIKETRGLKKGGRIQRFVDSEVIKLMEPYTPFQTGKMHRSSLAGTVIGSGNIRYLSPYARYQYYGQVYGPNIPIKENGVIIGYFSPKNKKKHPTGRQLKYSKEKHPRAGKLWFERMKADKKERIIQGAKRLM